MKATWKIAWQRFSLNSSIVADFNGRFIATLFYFTIMLPFGVLSALFMDPLRVKRRKPEWLERDAVADDIDSARAQG